MEGTVVCEENGLSLPVRLETPACGRGLSDCDDEQVASGDVFTSYDSESRTRAPVAAYLKLVRGDEMKTSQMRNAVRMFSSHVPIPALPALNPWPLPTRQTTAGRS